MKLKSSKLGIQKYLKNFIIRLLSNNEFIKENTDTELASINAQKISNNIQINLNSYASDHFVQKIHNTDKDLIFSFSSFPTPA